jgi:hypothetical protein
VLVAGGRVKNAKRKLFFGGNQPDCDVGVPSDGSAGEESLPHKR